MNQIRICVTTLLLALLAWPSSGLAVEEFSLEFLLALDREVSGLLGAYLEAVPECPVRNDTPIRLWVLDAAWLRTRAVLDEAKDIEHDAASEFPVHYWEVYLTRSREYLEVFGSLQRRYHEDTLPDSALCVQMELQILEADSLWSIAELNLFVRLTEEGYNE